MDSVNQLAFEIEKLETREMLAGDVDVIVRDGDVFVRGDSQDNSIEVTLDSDGRLIVTGLDGTTVNNGETGITANNLTIRMRGGDDQVIVQTDANLNIANDLSIFGNGGDDRIELKSGVGGETIVEAGSGRNSIMTENFFPDGDVLIGSGCGSDNILITLVQSNDIEFVVKTRGGADSIDVISSNFNTLDIETAGGNDSVRIAAEAIDVPLQVSIAAESNVALGAGRDAFETNIFTFVSMGYFEDPVDRNNSDGAVVARGMSRQRGVEAIIPPRLATSPSLLFTTGEATLTVSGQGGSDVLQVNGQSSSSATASSHVNAAIFDGFESDDSTI